MPQSPRLPQKENPTTERPLNAPMLLLLTGLDTTWRLFVPTLGGVIGGIAIDTWLNTKPIAMIICLILGTILTIVLVTRQLTTLGKPRK